MPDQPPSPMNPDAIKLHNDEVMRQQAAQDISGHPMTPAANEDTSSALDGLMGSIVEKKKDEGDPAPDPKGAEGKPSVTPEPDPAKGQTPPVEPDPAKGQTPPAPIPDPAAPEDHFKTVELPAGSKGKVSESFNALKTKANAEIMERDTRLKELQTEVDRLKKIEANPVPQELQTEVDELRRFRSQLDVSLDPAFKKFDATASSASEFIYDQLRKTGKVGEEHIKQIKDLGGPSNVNFEKIFKAIGDPVAQRMIENKVIEIETANFEKQRAIEAAKSNVDEYMKGRAEEFSAAATQHNTATQKTLEGLVAKLDWMKPIKSEDPAAVKAHDEFVKEVQGNLKTAAGDDSPEMRALLIAGMGQLLHAQRVIPALKSQMAKDKAAHETALKEVTDKLEAAEQKLMKIKAAGKSRLEESQAPGGGLPAPASKAADVQVPPSQAVDDLMKDIMDKKKLAAAAHGS